MLPFLALLALTLAWLLLPLLPALRELFRPTDVAPLTVVDRSSGYLAFFARNFRQYLERQLAALPAPPASGQPAALPDGTPLLTLRFPPAEDTQNRVVLFEAPVTLAGGETFLQEVYARDALTGGPKAIYRAVYAERDLALAEGSRVFRWVHAEGRLSVGAHSVLRGRASSQAGISLGGNIEFERLAAPVIAVGREHEPPPEAPALPQSWKLPDTARTVGEHVRVPGDLAIPEGVRVTASLVVEGRLRLGMGAIVEGSVKAHGQIELADEAQITGAAVTRTRLMAGQASWIGGPAIAEERIRLGKGAVVGGPSRPATVDAPEVELATGATVYGQINAMRGARTF